MQLTLALIASYILVSCTPTRSSVSNNLQSSQQQGTSSKQGSGSSGGTSETKATVLSSNFTIPIIRFNRIENDATIDDRKGNVSFFNSVGAGIGIYRGVLTEIKDNNDKVIDTELDNLIGFQVGFLFAANASGSNNTNIFALTSSVSILNFQIGYGYEFGTVGADDKRGFFTLAYGIPLHKLVRGGSYIMKRGSAVDANKGFMK